MTDKIEQFLKRRRPQTPCLVVDLDAVETNYRRLAEVFPQAEIYYAVKANPAPEILRRLRTLGSRFDAASVHEVVGCLDLGIDGGMLSFGSTIKKERDIERAHRGGVQLFAFDAQSELRKIARAAPGAQVLCRIITSGRGADWPLSRKFGCELDMAHDLLIEADRLGLRAAGVSFHVGSQQRDPEQWDIAIGETARLFTDLNAAGIELSTINLGGGFPASYRSAVPPIEAYGETIARSMARHFGNHRPDMVIEPGRYLVGDAGVIQSEVVLIAQKGYGQRRRRWVYLDVGKFGGLPETIGEAIKYRLRTPHDGTPCGPVVLSGPTCDEVDVLYEESEYALPLDLAEGDRVEILAAGAYTASYASVGFNGFPPMKQYFV